MRCCIRPPANFHKCNQSNNLQLSPACHAKISYAPPILRQPDNSLRFRVELEGTEPDGESFELPEIATRLLLHVLDETAHGNAVALVPMHAELTTNQAADLLNVSRPFLVKLIEEGIIPCRKVGTHRRVRMEDLANYRKQHEEMRNRSLAMLTRETRDLGLYEDASSG
jgi:excisionase family DNA binding protein